LHSFFTYTAKEIIGKRIKILRKQHNLTLQELADKIGADRQYIWNIENGEINLTLDYLVLRLIILIKLQKHSMLNKATS